MIPLVGKSTIKSRKIDPEMQKQLQIKFEEAIKGYKLFK